MMPAFRLLKVIWRSIRYTNQPGQRPVNVTDCSCPVERRDASDQHETMRSVVLNRTDLYELDVNLAATLIRPALLGFDLVRRLIVLAQQQTVFSDGRICVQVQIRYSQARRNRQARRARRQL